MASRNKVFWIGPQPEKALAQEFRCRDITLDVETLRGLPLNLKTLRNLPLSSITAARLISQELGAVFVHERAKFPRTISFLKQVMRAPVKDSGARICIVVSDTGEINNILRKLVRGSSFAGFHEEYNVSFQILNKDAFGDFAKYFKTPDPGRPPRLGLLIELDSPFSPSETTLLQRSFSDCDSIVIRKLSEQGFSARVYVAYPQFSSDPEHARSLPFLVKFDEKKDVEKERNYYETYVNQYVPFNLRPNVDATRCFSSGSLGILVANYVDKAIPLLEAIEKGAGPIAIHCLFGESLDRWFRNSKCQPGSPVKALQNLFDKEKFEKNPDVIQEARKIGPVPGPTKLLQTLQTIQIKSHRSGKSHRDLHARNVLVKGSDAIVIDFSQCDSGPMLIDLATLEVTIAFYSAIRNKNAVLETFDSWIKFVRQLYDYERVTKLPEAREDFEPFPRQWSCIRQIRRFALMEQTDELEFAVCLAIALLRLSMFVDHPVVGVRVAANAYYLCSELINEIKVADSNREHS